VDNASRSPHLNTTSKQTIKYCNFIKTVNLFQDESRIHVYKSTTQLKNYVYGICCGLSRFKHLFLRQHYPTMRYKHSVLFLFMAMLSACAVVKPPAPSNEGVDIPKIVQPVSNIEIPVSADLKSYIVQAENSVPAKYSDNQQPCEGLRYNYVFTRTPFAIIGSNNVVNLQFTGSYGFTVSYCAKCGTLFGSQQQCLVPVISAQCGMGGEPLRRMVISYQSTINVTPDFHLRSKTILYPAPKPIDRCSVLMGNIDITDRLIQYISGPLNDLGKQVDARIAAYDIRPQVNQLWKNLATEIQLPDVGYLNINPQAVQLSNFTLSGSSINFTVGLSAKPVVTVLSQQQQPKPMPNLSAYLPANGFNIYLDLLENYDHLTRTVNQQLHGQQVEVVGHTFIVDSTRVYGIGSKIAMQVNFSGTNTGTIYLTGTPTYDQKTHELSFPDLNFDLKTKTWMLKAAKWMFNGVITDMMRKRATYNFSSFIADSKERLQKQISQGFGSNIQPQVTFNTLDIQAIYPTAEKLIIRTQLNGNIKVNMVM
jgi:hypothetical protein